MAEAKIWRREKALHVLFKEAVGPLGDGEGNSASQSADPVSKLGSIFHERKAFT
jgi:hypothetical protein